MLALREAVAPIRLIVAATFLGIVSGIFLRPVRSQIVPMELNRALLGQFCILLILLTLAIVFAHEMSNGLLAVIVYLLYFLSTISKQLIGRVGSVR